jgi:hypothetical protein
MLKIRFIATFIVLLSAPAFATLTPTECRENILPVERDPTRTTDPAILDRHVEERLRERGFVISDVPPDPQRPTFDSKLAIKTADHQDAAFISYQCLDYALEISFLDAFGPWVGKGLEEFAVLKALARCPGVSQIRFKPIYNEYVEHLDPERAHFLKPDVRNEGLRRGVESTPAYRALAAHGFSEAIPEKAEFAPFILRNPLHSVHWRYQTENFIEKMRAYRLRKIKRTSVKTFEVNSVKYDVGGFLGESTSRVYLATAPNGQRVTIKRIVESEDTPGWLGSVAYETEISAFYAEKGLIVPKVIGSEVRPEKGKSIGYLVKHYHEGILFDDFQESAKLKGNDSHRFEEARRIEIAHVREIHRGFRKWLEMKKSPLLDDRTGIIQSLIDRGDFDGFSYGNWLFDLDRETWIVFDP